MILWFKLKWLPHIISISTTLLGKIQKCKIYGVPTTVYALSQVFSNTLEIPKSPIFISPSAFRKIFEVLISLCNILWEWI